MLEDPIPHALAAPVPRDAVLEPRAPVLDREVDQPLLADDMVLAPTLVRQARVDAQLAGAAVGRRDRELDTRERKELAAVPQAADADVRLGAEVDAHGVEPEVAAELPAQIAPAVELRPVTLAAPAVVAVGEAVDRVGDARERHRAADRAALLDVAGNLIEAHSGRMRIEIGRAQALPDDVHRMHPVPVAEPEALERGQPLDQETAGLETPRLDGRHRQAVIDQAVHHRPAVGEEEKEVRLAKVRVDAGAEHHADLALRIVEGKPEALVPERQ